VIKSLGEVFGNIAGIAGGAILGDGRVGLILDPKGVFESSAKQAAALHA
jgi:two-component system chemotaxis sensor kinase CheA